MNTKTKKILMLLLISVMVLAGCKSATDDNYNGDAQTLKAEADAKAAQAASEESANEGETEVESTTDVEQPVIVEEAQVTQYPYTFVDKFGNEMVIEAKPERVVSFSPELTETLFAIGAGESLVGRSTYCDYPAEAAEVADLGDLWSFSLESVVEVNPDVVFLSSMVSEEVYTQLVDNGIKVVVYDFDQTLGGALNYIRNVGIVMDRHAEAIGIIEGIRETINAVALRGANRAETSVYYVVSAGEFGDSAATGDTFIGDMIVACGAVNAAADGTDWMYTIEQLVEKDPEIMICSSLWETKQTIESLEGYKDLTAVKEGKLYEVDENLFSRQGPRVGEALLELEKIIYGE